jgi:hypothetical protein
MPLLDEAADVRQDRVALVTPLEDAVLHVDDQEGSVRPVLECGHRLPSSRVAPGPSDGTVRVRARRLSASQNRSACSGDAASVKLGRFPFAVIKTSVS